MGRLRYLFDHPRFLADGPSACRAVARTASISIYSAVARVDCDVGSSRAGHPALARSTTLSSRLAVGAGGIAVRMWVVCLFAIREKFQREPTRRPAGSSWRKSGSAPGDRWNPGACAASCIPGASVRDAGMERRNRPRSLLGPDGIRSGHRSGDDPDGGCGIGKAVRGLLPRLSPIRARSSAASVHAAPAIIRSD